MDLGGGFFQLNWIERSLNFIGRFNINCWHISMEKLEKLSQLGYCKTDLHGLKDLSKAKTDGGQIDDMNAFHN